MHVFLFSENFLLFLFLASFSNCDMYMQCTEYSGASFAYLAPSQLQCNTIQLCLSYQRPRALDLSYGLFGDGCNPGLELSSLSLDHHIYLNASPASELDRIGYYS